MCFNQDLRYNKSVLRVVLEGRFCINPKSMILLVKFGSL